MRRVVVTGMGIVSSIGNTTQEVLASLHEGEVRHRAGRGLRRARLPLPGPRRADARSRRPCVDRRAMRFHGGGTAWNHVAMDQAIRDAGLEPGEISQRAHRHHHGLGRPLDPRHRRRRRQDPREGLSKKVGPFAVPKAMSSTASATLATWFKIKGVNYSISSACATSNHCIGNAYEMIQCGKQDVMFAGGCEELDWTLSVLFDAMGAMSSKFNERPAVASRAYDTQPRRLRHRRRRRRAGAGGTGARQGARRPHLWRDRRLRRDLGRLRHGRAVRRGRGALHAHGAGDREGARSTTSTRTPPRRRSAIGKEIEAIREVFGSGDKCPPISATKSLTGHSLGATGVQEAIYSLLMMNNGFICESAHIEELDPAFADMPIVRKRIDNARLGTVLSNSFGFGGTNATLVLKRLDAVGSQQHEDVGRTPCTA